MTDGNAPKRIFLRKVLYRLDYQFITEQKQEEIYTFIAENYRDYFTERGCEEANTVDIQINSPGTPVFNTKPQTVFYLFQPKTETTDGRTIKIGKTFIFLDLDLGIESMKIPYYTWFANIINFLKDMKLFKPTRIGLRKFNAFYILDKDTEKLKQIFSIPYFDSITGTPFALDRFNNMQTYTAEKYSLNFLREYTTGYLNNPTIQNELSHQITFDFDIFSENFNVLNDFCQDAQQGLEEMNQHILDFFTKLISSDIYAKINAGDLLTDYGIIPF